MNQEEDKRKAVERWAKAAEQGDVEAQSELGRRYYFGDGVEQDHKKAVEWYRKAAKQGYAHAQCCLGWCYEGGEDVDYEKAVYWYAKAAKQGHAGAQYNLGCCYFNGEGVEKDFKKAVEWWTKAADQGVAVAQYKLGLCYEKGNGVKQDQDKAAKWFTKAAEQRYANAGEDRAEEDGAEGDEAKGVVTKGDGGDGSGCLFIIIVFLFLCVGRLWLHDRDGHTAQESDKAMQGIKKNRKTRGTYEVWRAWRKYKDNMEEKNDSMTLSRVWQKYKGNKECEDMLELLAYRKDYEKEKNERRAREMKRNIAPIIGGWEATINEGDSIRVVNLNIVSEHLIYSTGLMGNGRERETWMSIEGNRYTYYSGNERFNLEVRDISGDTLCAFLSVGNETAVIPFIRMRTEDNF